MNGLHDMLTNMISAVIMDPRESLNHHVCLAFLGHVSDKLKDKCNWSNETYTAAVNAHKNKTGKFMGGQDSFIYKCFNLEDEKTGPYLRLVIQDMANLNIPTHAFEKKLYIQSYSYILDVSHRFFNYSDSVVAVVASELVDLHENDKGMANFDAFTEASLR